jgi:acid phosphatase
VILPVIQGVVDILRSGPETPVIEQNGEEGVLGPLIVAFTHDNQINQMVSSLGIFDEQPPLPSDQMNSSRVRSLVIYDRAHTDDKHHRYTFPAETIP